MSQIPTTSGRQMKDVADNNRIKTRADAGQNPVSTVPGSDARRNAAYSAGAGGSTRVTVSNLRWLSRVSQ